MTRGSEARRLCKTWGNRVVIIFPEKPRRGTAPVLRPPPHPTFIRMTSAMAIRHPAKNKASLFFFETRAAVRYRTSSFPLCTFKELSIFHLEPVRRGCTTLWVKLAREWVWNAPSCAFEDKPSVFNQARLVSCVCRHASGSSISRPPRSSPAHTSMLRGGCVCSSRSNHGASHIPANRGGRRAWKTSVLVQPELSDLDKQLSAALKCSNVNVWSVRMERWRHCEPPDVNWNRMLVLRQMYFWESKCKKKKEEKSVQ